MIWVLLLDICFSLYPEKWLSSSWWSMALSYAKLFLWEIDVLLLQIVLASDYEIARHCKLEGSTQRFSIQFLLSGMKLRTCIDFLANPTPGEIWFFAFWGKRPDSLIWPWEVICLPPLFSGRSCAAGQDRWIFGKVLDPQSTGMRHWNRLFLLSCALGVAVDPLFLSVFSINKKLSCLYVQRGNLIVLTSLRGLVDFAYLVQVWPVT